MKKRRKKSHPKRSLQQQCKESRATKSQQKGQDIKNKSLKHVPLPKKATKESMPSALPKPKQTNIIKYPQLWGKTAISLQNQGPILQRQSCCWLRSKVHHVAPVLLSQSTFQSTWPTRSDSRGWGVWLVGLSKTKRNPKISPQVVVFFHRFESVQLSWMGNESVDFEGIMQSDSQLEYGSRYLKHPGLLKTFRKTLVRKHHH